MKKLTLTILLLATAMVARAYDLVVATPQGQVLYYTITSSNTVKVVSGPTKPTGRLTIPYTVQGYAVTEIASMAFNGCTGLTSVSVPGSVTTIGMRAFAGCSALTSAIFAEGVRTFGSMVFSSCTSLDTISLPTTITQLATGCFGNTAIMTNPNRWQDSALYVSHYLVAVRAARTGTLVVADSTLGIASDALDYCHISKCVLPAGLHFVGDMAFKDCTLLDTVRLLGITPPTLGSDSFQGTAASLIVAVPCNSATAYSAAQHWSQLTIVEDPCPTPPVSITSAQANSIETAISGNTLRISGTEGQSLTVSDITGRRIFSVTSANDNMRVDLPSTGVYIVSVGSAAPLKVCYLK